MNLPHDSYTFVVDMCGSSSWLDHAICSPKLDHCISNLKIDYNQCKDDHVPFHFDLAVDEVYQAVHNYSRPASINWGKLSQLKLKEFYCQSLFALNLIVIPQDVVHHALYPAKL